MGLLLELLLLNEVSETFKSVLVPKLMLIETGLCSFVFGMGVAALGPSKLDTRVVLRS